MNHPAPDAESALAACLFAVDPPGLGGVALRSRPGPERDGWLAHLRALLPAAPFRRLPSHITDGRLLGGLDLAATLRAGRPVAERGLLAEVDGGVLVVAMAERQAPAMVARLAATLDAGAATVERDGLTLSYAARFGIVALDEGLEEDERPHPGLLDRLAFHLVPAAGPGQSPPPCGPGDIAAARDRLHEVTAGDDVVAALCGAAMALGIDSPRAALLALAASRCHAALAGRREVTLEDAAVAARLVLAPRATRLPAEPAAEAAEPEPAPPEPRDAGATDDCGSDDGQAMADAVISAVKAAIPPGLLALLQQRASRRRLASGRAGGAQRSGSRGRPAGTRAGSLRAGERLHVLETLRAAAPWQAVRRRESPGAATAPPPRFLIRPEDFRIARHKPRTRSTTIFVVDASGSAAMHRLAEAKGAVELLLAECYVRRDRVALVAFRNRGADVLLPPTRSLARARRNLAGLPGGGGTPLAAGIDAAAALAAAVRRAGETPTIVLLGDGRPNIRRDGTPGRPEAEADAIASAKAVAALGIAALCIDTAPRPQPFGRDLADAMGARYVALPQADAAALSSAAATLAGNRPRSMPLLAS